MIESSEILSGENIAAKCDYVFSQTRAHQGEPYPYIAEEFPALSDGDIVFCKTDFLGYLKQCFDLCVHPNMKIAVITHDSDFSLTDEKMSQFSNKSIAWWGMNCESKSANPLPIGIANSYCKKTLKTFDIATPNRLLYVNHRVETYPSVRQKVYDQFSQNSWATVKHPYSSSENDQYRLDLLDHKFILCPRGNGIDTHRIWEALYCGVIPVVIRHETHRLLEGKLPILFVDSYEEVEKDMLNAEYDRIKNTTWNLDMLKTSWWIDRIKEGITT